MERDEGAAVRSGNVVNANADVVMHVELMVQMGAQNDGNVVDENVGVAEHMEEGADMGVDRGLVDGVVGVDVVGVVGGASVADVEIEEMTCLELRRRLGETMSPYTTSLVVTPSPTAALSFSLKQSEKTHLQS
eukprot:TRINITY_DN15957_c0_g1_i1.p2 TRINITY_DN15957_c0_g1~~TRINITY_DN15957_c0_g1_i1.p2  ORF type:complete len:133 (-),score=25.53 TRINITY_DN15957_c0_g1_i1:183-581(-)